jgi:hypothetical protein
VRFTLSTAWAANKKGGPKTLSDPNSRGLDLGFRSQTLAHRLRGGFDYPNYASSDPSWESEGPSEESASEREEEEDEEEVEEEDDVGDQGDLMDLSAGADDAASPGGSQRAKPDAGAKKAETDSEGENLEDLLAKFIGEGDKEGSDSQDISEEW